MRQCFSWEVNSASATEKIPIIFWEPNYNYRVPKRPPLIFILILEFSRRQPQIIMPSDTSRSTKVLSSFRFIHQNLFCTSVLPNTCYMPPTLQPYHNTWYYPTNFWRIIPNYEELHCVVLCSLLPHPLLGLTYSLAHYSRTSLVHVIPLMLETKFHVHTKQVHLHFSVI